MQEACITQNPLRLGEAATLSAIASQTLLPKPGFTALLSLVEECDLYGLNVAHSGSVVGLMLDRKRHDIARLKGKLAEKNLPDTGQNNIYLKMVTGGSNCSEPDICPTAVAHYSAFTSACFISPIAFSFWKCRDALWRFRHF